MTTVQFSLILLIYTFIDALDNPVYGFLSDRTRTRWGRRRPWLVIGTPLLVLCFIAFYSTPAFLAGNSLFAYAMLFYILTGTLDSVINANYGALFPELFRDDASRASYQCPAAGLSTGGDDHQHRLTPVVTQCDWVPADGHPVWIAGRRGHPIYDLFLQGGGNHGRGRQNPNCGTASRACSPTGNSGSRVWRMPFTARPCRWCWPPCRSLSNIPSHIPDSQSTILFASVLLIAIGCVTVWARLVRKFGLIPIWRVALASLAVAFIPLFFANSLLTAIFGSALVGFGFAGVITTMDLIGAKIMDEDTQKHNLRREGIISNAMGFMNRLNGLFTSAAFFLVFGSVWFRERDKPWNAAAQCRPVFADGLSAGVDADQFCLLVLYQLWHP